MTPWIPQGLLTRTFPKDAVAFCYHIVSNAPLEVMRYYAYKNEVQFAADVAYIAGTRGVISYEELRQSRLQGNPRPPWNRVLLTFDDGFRCCHETVRPILLKARVPAVFFVLGDCIDNRAMFFESKVSLCITAAESLSADEARDLLAQMRGASKAVQPDATAAMDELRMRSLKTMFGVLPSQYHEEVLTILLSFEQEDEPEIDRVCALLNIDPAVYLKQHPVYLSEIEIAELAADGFTIGSHGWSHRRAQHMTPDELEHEIVSSCRRIMDITGQETVPFAFPYGGTGVDRELLQNVRSRHACVDLIFDTAGMARDEPFVVNRIWGDPPPAEGDGTNLPVLLKQAWVNRNAWWRP
jgi:peptidoglycan/xylan/chitin deacetylase (PgdA/CDA1 family)